MQAVSPVCRRRLLNDLSFSSEAGFGPAYAVTGALEVSCCFDGVSGGICGGAVAVQSVDVAAR
jgi:hypothetical protein